MPHIAETPRLIIRNFKADEEDAYVALLLDEQVKVHLPKRTEEQVRAGFRDGIATNDTGAPFNKWAIVDKESDELAGMGLLREYDNHPDILEVGYCLHERYWNKGIGTELTIALIDYARTFPQIKAIVAVTTQGNIPSQKVLLKAGLMQQENITRDEEELSFFSITL